MKTKILQKKKVQTMSLSIKVVHSESGVAGSTDLTQTLRMGGLV